MRKAKFVVFILFTILSLCRANTLICNEMEKQALLSFKNALTDQTNRLSSWSPNADCCGWTGVRCDNMSGRVVGIHLGDWNDTEATGSHRILGGEISPALLDLQFLNHLDLSFNDFGGNPIPTFLGSMQSLSVLHLFNASFGGIIPPQLGNLSSLQNLSLGCISAFGCEIHIENFSWISRLSSLETLAIRGIDLHKEVHWLEYVSVLPSLSTLLLVQCQLGSLNPSLKYVNFTSLSHLYLPYNNFSHELPNWMFNLSSNLVSIDLCGNSLRGQISSTISNLHNLAYLDLSENHLEGRIPPQLGNFSGLHTLGLGCSDALNCELYFENFSWISRLSSLEILLLKGMDLHKEVHWLEYLSVLPSLSSLYMIQCQLDNMSPSLKYLNFTSLSLLYLSFNNFNHELPNWLFNLSNLRYMYLGSNSLQGQIPSTILNLYKLVYLNFWDNHLKGQIPVSLGQLKYLTELHLSLNSLNGQIPSSIGNLSYLSTLDLRYGNQLNGTLPESMGRLSNLKNLAITGNPLSGTVSEAHFSKLSQLKFLLMSRTNLAFNVSSNWIPPFQLQHIGLRSCKVGPKFPAWLQTQRYLQGLIMSNSGIVDTAPNWLWKWASQIPLHLDLSNNWIAGNLSNVLLNNMVVRLSSNRFTGDLPRLTQNVLVFDIANNPFPRNISSFLCRKVSGGSKLGFLILSNNSLFGKLSNCLMHWPSLTHLSIGGNNISGKVPDSIGSLLEIQYLYFSNNTLSGEIPPSLQNCTSLRLLDLAENKFSGEIPGWIGNMSNLQILSLRSNKLTGDIPPQICRLSALTVLDLADNSLSRAIPKCISNFSRMARIDTALNVGLKFVLIYFIYIKFDVLSLVVKGKKKVYGSTLGLVRTIDFSSNNLSGTIPIEISSLSGLQFLNLSRNHLTGMIPEKVGSMKSLESLDLSRNHLSGSIPGSITNLSFLADLDLSYNNLLGRIPSSTQLQSFDPLRFIGNAGLCGPPLTINCTKKGDFEGANHIEESREEFELTWFYIGMASGFALSFWGVFGVLILKREWRHAYFRFLDGTRDQLYVATVLKMKRLREHLRGHRTAQERRGEKEDGGS